MDLEKLRQTIIDFENKLVNALHEKYFVINHLCFENDLIRQHIVDMSLISKWKIIDFFDQYIKTQRYPIDRLDKVIDLIFEIKVQLYCLLEVDYGLTNSLVYGRGFDKNSPNKTPHLHLVKLSFNQSDIIKSRILWERIMNLIYFLSNGKELVSNNKKSKKGNFFRFARNSPEWQWICDYEDKIQSYDDDFRTPEVHKGSKLKKEFITNIVENFYDLSDLTNYALIIWPNLLEVISGRNAYLKFTITKNLR